MRKLNKLFLALFATCICIAVQGETHAEILNNTPVYRLYNPNSGEHFYTTSKGEYDYLDRIGWSAEGIAWYKRAVGQPVYRLYNPNTGDHHYTVVSGERDYLIKVGWHDEGIGSLAAGPTPVYRLYNPNAKKAGAHHFTINSHERDVLVKVGWRYEGVGWYVASQAQEEVDPGVAEIPE